MFDVYYCDKAEPDEDDLQACMQFALMGLRGWFRTRPHPVIRGEMKQEPDHRNL